MGLTIVAHSFGAALLWLLYIWVAAGNYFESDTYHLRVGPAIQPFNFSYQCDISNVPNPSPEFPIILFRDSNYNNCSSSGFYVKVRKGQFHKFSSNNVERRFKNIFFQSMLILHGVNVSFLGCCPSGMELHKTMFNWQSTPDVNHSVFYTMDLGSSSGIYYAGWPYWDTSYYVKVDEEQEVVNNATCSSTCFYGECGAAGKCECAPGYSGPQCKTRPTNDTFPTQQKPLVLFTETNFEGTYIKVDPETFRIFATNQQNSRNFHYKSARVLYNRTVTFARNLVNRVELATGGDIEDLESFLEGNLGIARPLWIKYEQYIVLDFWIKVAGNPGCDNCTVNGCCYTGTCQCFPGYTGTNCETSIS